MMQLEEWLSTDRCGNIRGLVKIYETPVLVSGKARVYTYEDGEYNPPAQVQLTFTEIIE